MGIPYVGDKTFDFSSKKKDFLPQNDQIWPKSGIFGQLCALLVSRLVVVARGLYLPRHLFTLSRTTSVSKHLPFKFVSTNTKRFVGLELAGEVRI